MTTTSPSNKAERLQLLKEEVKKCTQCAELANYRTQTVFGVGNPDADIVFIGEAPGADEDKQGVPFVGRAGQLLDEIITEGMKLRREDVYICNVLCCRPPENRDPRSVEADNCRMFLDETLAIIKPKFICCLGAVASQKLLRTKEDIETLRGKVHNYNGISVICTYHPTARTTKEEKSKDIRFLMEQMGR